MAYLQAIQSAAENPAAVEALYQDAVQRGEAGDFRQAIEVSYQATPANLLYAAWHHRLAQALAQVPPQAAGRRHVAWGAAVVLALFNGLLFWWFSDAERYAISLTGLGDIPNLMLLWAPMAAVVAMCFLAWAGRRAWLPVALLSALAATLSAAPFLLYGQLPTATLQEHYFILALFHLPLIGWGIVGLFLLYRAFDAADRFAFLIKSLEVFVMGGLLGIALGIFTFVSVMLFQALSIDFPEWVLRLFVPGSLGLVPVLAIAIIYNPQRTPAQQPFDEGLSRLIAVVMRVMLPLTLTILVIYLAFIPFNFWEPFRNRDVLIAYNAMLFAVMALLVGATPVSLTSIGAREQRWLRRGLVAVAALALLVSLYALAALGYRTVQEGWTPNRFTFVGWNLLNSGLLAWLLVRQWRGGPARWLQAVQATFAAGIVAYGIWSVVVLLLVPLLF